MTIGEVGKGRLSGENRAVGSELDILVCPYLDLEMERASISQFPKYQRRMGSCGTIEWGKTEVERSTAHGI